MPIVVYTPWYYQVLVSLYVLVLDPLIIETSCDTIIRYHYFGHNNILHWYHHYLLILWRNPIGGVTPSDPILWSPVTVTKTWSVKGHTFLEYPRHFLMFHWAKKQYKPCKSISCVLNFTGQKSGISSIISILMFDWAKNNANDQNWSSIFISCIS